jgi:hypothetical protein
MSPPWYKSFIPPIKACAHLTGCLSEPAERQEDAANLFPDKRGAPRLKHYYPLQHNLIHETADNF